MKALALAPVLALAAFALVAPPLAEAGHRHSNKCGHRYSSHGHRAPAHGYYGQRHYRPAPYYGGYGGYYAPRYYPLRPRYGYGYGGYGGAYGYGYGYYPPPPPPPRYYRRPRGHPPPLLTVPTNAARFALGGLRALAL